MIDSFNDLLTELADQPLTVDLFDDMAGSRQLTQVTVTLSGTLESEGFVTNTAAQPQTFQVSTLAQIFQGTTAAGAPSALPALEIFPTFGGTTIASQVFVDAPVDLAQPFGPDSISGSVMFMTSDPTELAQFVNPGGSFTYELDTLIATSIAGGGGNVFTDITTLASATLEVAYQFDATTPPAPVPAPAAVLLMGAGVLGLLGVRKSAK